MKRLLLLTIALLFVFSVVASAAECPAWTADNDSYTCTVGGDIVRMWNATGGTHPFTIPSGVTSLRLLRVGGGGAGAIGGGGGGYLFETLGISVIPGDVFRANVGANGTATIGLAGTDGGLSIIQNATTSFFGNGGLGAPYGATRAGDGGSGGGGGGATTENGGAGGTNGSNGVNSFYPAGFGYGPTTESNITGSVVRYSGAGGGTGGSSAGTTGGAGGLGGGGDGGTISSSGKVRGSNGTDGLGGGGGGGAVGSDYYGGDGGDGVIIARYANLAAFPVATFTATNLTHAFVSNTTLISGYAPMIVQFTNTTVVAGNITSHIWNATPISTGIPFTFNSTSAFPRYTFNDVDNYSISLNVSGTGGQNISTQVFWVNTSLKPTISANFVANVTSQTYPPGAIAFSDTSLNSPDSWSWNFGDGSTSTSQNPTHVYTTTGLKTVSLTAYNSLNLTDTSTITKTDYINITYSQFYIDPDFTGSPERGSPGLLVSFVDLTTVGNSSATRTCNWSFGDSFSATPYSSSCGNVQHVYAYSGVYDVNLSVTMFGNTSYENKQSYITISTDQGPQLQVYPKFTTFHVKSDVFGTPLEGVNVSVSPISTSMGAWDWIGTLLGIPIGEVNLDNTSLYQTTDSYGRATFFIVNTQKYNVTFVKTGYTINPLIVVPQDDNYIVTATSTESQFYRDGVNELTTVNISVTTTLYNSTHAFINLTYNDSSLHTTGGYIEVLQKNDKPWTNPTQMAYWPVTGNSFSNSTVIVHIQQVSGYVNANITHTDFGQITRSYPYSFNSVPVEFLGFSKDITLIVALGIMLFTMMLGGAAHSRILVVIVATEGWIFYTMHWFQALFDRGVPEEMFTLALTLVFLTGIIANILMRKKRGI